jgi:ubiquinone/menaquinone biosynthesis C-methylase UbiE
MTSFKDNFSIQANVYSKYRPTYPPELFEYLSKLTPEHQLAWDCGTGNGQAAIGLTKYYTTIYATDPSEQQIKNVFSNTQIIYKVEKAEQSSLPDTSVDLITVAQALHWFDFDLFYTEVKRVLKQNGIIAIWAYGVPVISTEIDSVIEHFHNEVVGEFWQPENRLINLKYSTIPFPFRELQPPCFKIQKILSLNELLGIIRSWSATQKFIDEKKVNPLELIKIKLQPHWGNEESKRVVTWPLILKIGQK